MKKNDLTQKKIENQAGPRKEIISNQEAGLFKIAFILTVLTIVYNIVEGIVATFFGIQDEALALLGFGIDSFVEVASGIGIAHMIIRMRKSQVDSKDQFEKTALKITAISFFILASGLILGSLLNIINNTKPDTTKVGIIVSSVSILTMWFLYSKKIDVGRKLKSEPIIADAKCTKTCFYLSFILLASSLLYEFFRINYIDIIGSMGIAFFAFTEGKEAFEKANSKSISCDCGNACSK